jgi:hypothetical protein
MTSCRVVNTDDEILSSDTDTFPQEMVGVWQTDPNLDNTRFWQIYFKEDGSVPKITHSVFGPIAVKEGGMFREGPDPESFLMAVVKPVQSSYDKRNGVIKVRIEIEEYEMKFPTGSIRGRMIDTFVGKKTRDGLVWEADWRNYGWIEGATEPDIQAIKKYPEHLVFRKIVPQR